LTESSEPTKSSVHVPASARIGRQEKFRKVLSFRDIYFISLGGTIGSAWLFGSVYGAATAGPAATLSWILGGVFVTFIALTWAEIGGMLPSTGAVVRAPQYAHGYFAGFYFGWAYFISAVAIPPVEAIAIVTYASAYLPALIKNGVLTVQGYAVGVSIMVFAFLLNSFGIRLFARFNTGITSWKLLVPTVSIVVAFLYFYPPNFSSFGGFAPYGFPPIFSAVGTAGIVFAYMGFREALDYSGEAKDPARDVPRAMIFSLLTTIVVYSLLQAAFIGGLRWNASGLPGGDWVDLANRSVYAKAPYFELMSILGVSSLATVLLFDAVVSPLGTVGVYTGSSARDLFALAEGGHTPSMLGEVHHKYGVPRAALLLSLGIGILFLFIFPSWGSLATVVTTAIVFTQLAGATSLMSLRRTAPELSRTFRLPAARLLAPLAFIMSSLIIYWTTWPYTGYAFVIVLTGVVLFIAAKARGAYPISDVRRGIWIVIYSVVLVILSYFGSYGLGYVPFPIDFVVIAMVAALFYYWGVRSGYETIELKRLKTHESATQRLREMSTLS
jgi:amino acid transporter